MIVAACVYSRTDEDKMSNWYAIRTAARRERQVAASLAERGFTFFLPLIGLICAVVGLAREPAGRAYAVVGLLLNGFFILMWVIFGSILISFMTNFF